jgi:hypothetical protein
MSRTQHPAVRIQFTKGGISKVGEKVIRKGKIAIGVIQKINKPHVSYRAFLD